MIKVDIKKGIYTPTHPRAVVTNRHGKVYLAFGKNELEMITPAAHRMAFALIRKSEEARRDNSYIVLTINRVGVHLLPREAKRIGTCLLLQSERADDFQRSLS